MRKPIRFIPDDTKLPFMRWSRFGFFTSGILCILSLLLFFTIGLNLGVDFKGGIVLTVRTAETADIDGMRQTLGGDKANSDAVNKVKQALGSSVEFRSEDVVGPKVSEELSQEAVLAVVASIVCVLIYLWIRFEWQFAIGAVLSLFHDVILSIGLFCLIGLEFNLSIIAAILTIVGYSLNDTVVVFDRIREFLRKYKQLPLPGLIDLSLNSVLPRTLLTSVSTLIALVALYVFGGEVIRGFTFAMIWGVLVGTYSSIFIASPVLILLGTKRDWSADAAKAEALKARP
jgi:preprotein translocase subunit SecF